MNKQFFFLFSSTFIILFKGFQRPQHKENISHTVYCCTYHIFLHFYLHFYSLFFAVFFLFCFLFFLKIFTHKQTFFKRYTTYVCVKPIWRNRNLMNSLSKTFVFRSSQMDTKCTGCLSAFCTTVRLSLKDELEHVQ